MEGYNFISQPTITNAGGVGFYLNQNITFSKRDQFSTSKQDYEGLWVEVENKHQRNIVCGIIYRHPKGNVETFLEYLYDVIESVHNENKLCILMGDFNVNLLNFESHPATEQFLNSLGTNFFHPHILKPTRITNHSATLIDNIFFNSAEHLTASGNILYDTSDHLPNFLIVKKLCSLPSKLKFFKRDYTNFDQSQFIGDISAIDWTNILPNCSDVNDMFGLFYSNLNNIVDKLAPLKQLSKEQTKISCKPWITKGLRTSIRKKNKLYLKFM